ncbi:hypothetical protein GE09DRAFT_552850 [Coniochaeta sp. 2T2.1]|nr:hypothetical protein GE09DRAFT_552850 [Coniochaeta sp. 2T2.1]
MNDNRGKADVEKCYFPENLDEQVALVRELYEPIVDCTAMKDHPVLQGSKKRKRKEGGNVEDAADSGPVKPCDNPQVSRVKAAPNVVLEILSWKLLYAIKNAQDGEIGISAWDGLDPLYRVYASLRQRLDKVIDALKMHESISDNVMMPDFIKRLAGAPEREHSRKGQNQKNSKDKKEYLAHGMPVVKRLRSTASSTAAGPASTLADHCTQNPTANIASSHGAPTCGAQPGHAIWPHSAVWRGNTLRCPCLRWPC